MPLWRARLTESGLVHNADQSIRAGATPGVSFPPFPRVRHCVGSPSERRVYREADLEGPISSHTSKGRRSGAPISGRHSREQVDNRQRLPALAGAPTADARHRTVTCSRRYRRDGRPVKEYRPREKSTKHTTRTTWCVPAAGGFSRVEQTLLGRPRVSVRQSGWVPGLMRALRGVIELPRQPV